METPRKVGTLVLVAGPSGAGKDTLISYCRTRLSGDSRVVFPRRAITRSDGDDTEDHLPLTEVEFERRVGRGEFALHWRAHGLGYGIPISIDVEIAAGRSVVVNVSRSVIEEARGHYDPLLILSVTATREVLAHRLRNRRREEDRDIERRLARADGPVIAGPDVTHLDNSGSIEEAGDAMLRAIARVLH